MATLLERNGHCGTHNLVSIEDWFATSARNLATEQLVAAQLSPVLLTCTNLDGFVPTCYTCGVVGHKSPDCPSKTSNGSKRVEVKKEPENADKSKKKSFKQAEVSVLYNGPTNTIQASLYGQPLPLLLDTGAQLSVVPKELVPPAARTGKKECLKGYKGRVDEVELTSISLCVGKRVWKGEAALVNGSDLDGKGILAVDILLTVRHGKSCLNLGRVLYK